MNDGPGLDLGRPREVGQLLGDSLLLLTRNLPTFLLIAATIVVPVQLVVSGVGLEELTAHYRDKTSTAEFVIPTVVSYFVIAPLITATTIHAVRAVADGQHPHAGRALQAGFDAFAPVFVALLFVAAGVTLGLFALIVPGIYLFVRWYFVPQTVVIEGARGPAALERSGRAVDGAWLRTFGLVLLANLVATIPGILILTPLEAAAKAADSQAVSLAGNIAVEALTTPFVALVSTLLYYDLRARRKHGLI